MAAIAAGAIDPFAARYARARAWRTVHRAARLEPEMTVLDGPGLTRAIVSLRATLHRDGPTTANLPRAGALLREVARRRLGKRPYDVQLLAMILMAEGRLVEMSTGEGKSLVALLTAALAALSGRPAHVITVNDFLAERDADEARTVFDRLGLSSGAILHDAQPDARRAIYARDIVYASNKEIAFDHLRDSLAFAERGGTRAARLQGKLSQLTGRSRPATDQTGRPPVMRGLHFAIVDEADSVLIDEARTPLILSAETDAEAERAAAEAAVALSAYLDRGRHYRVNAAERHVTLTPAGRARAEQMAPRFGDRFRNSTLREEAVDQALRARLFYSNGDQYVVQDGKVVIVDEYTGRLMPERSWNGGLQQIVELTEGVEVTPRKRTIARTTYQRFFGRYLHLSGMTGTAREVAREMAGTFGLRAIRVPTRLPSRMARGGSRVVRTSKDKAAEVARRAAQVADQGRPVLIGTRTVAGSEQVSDALKSYGLPHDVLSATQAAEEADIVARAGEAGRVTVATNMAGRGVHIDLSEDVITNGGLHVILTDRHDSARIDRQLYGRSARQGQPGSIEAVLALDDPMLGLARTPLARLLSVLPGPVGRLAGLRRFARAQARAERLNRAARLSLIRHDRKLRDMMAFTGEE